MLHIDSEQAHSSLSGDSIFVPYDIAPAAKRKPGRPRKARPSDSALSIPTPSKTRAQRKYKASHTSTTPSSPAPSLTFEVTVLVLQKDTVIKGKGGKAAKTTKTDPVPYSLDVATNASWPEFLEQTSETLHLPSVHQLRQESFRWFFSKQDIKLPLCDQDGFERLLRRLSGRRGNQSKQVHLEMQPPLQVIKAAQDDRVCIPSLCTIFH